MDETITYIPMHKNQLQAFKAKYDGAHNG